MRLSLCTALVGMLVLLPEPAYAQFGVPGNANRLVYDWYVRYLNREPDPFAASWVDALRRGQPPLAVLAQLLGSPEYYAKGGGTPAGFIHTIYVDVIGRPPNAGEMAFWLPRLAWASRSDVAYALLTYSPPGWQAPPPGYYGPRGWGYTPGPTFEYRRPGYPFWR
jgi:hypothetical protein